MCAHVMYWYFTNRPLSFDLEIAGTSYNGTCRPITEGNVVLSYRIGTTGQWKTIAEYSSVGKEKAYMYKHTHIFRQSY